MSKDLFFVPPFARRCREAAAGIWEKSREHPFVRALADGSLDPERFAFYQKQDARYLEGFADTCALISVRCELPADKLWFLEAGKLALVVEGELHRGYGKKLGYTEADIRALDLTPNCRGYRAHMIEQATAGSLLGAVAALTPCPWVYVDLGHYLLKGFPGDTFPDDHPYVDWLKTYIDPGFLTYMNELLERLERFAAEAGPRTQELAVEAFVNSVRYEYRFWDQAWTRQGWV
jgi:thiaminase/transcriptional activator TenA